MILAFIYCKGGPLLTAALQARSRSIRRAIEEAQQLSGDAKKRLAEVEKRWAKLDSEIAGLHARAEAEMKYEEEILMAGTTEAIRRTLEYSKLQIDQSALRGRRELRVFAADLAVFFARQSIRIDESLDQKLVGSLVEKLGLNEEIAQATSRFFGASHRYIPLNLSERTSSPSLSENPVIAPQAHKNYHLWHDDERVSADQQAPDSLNSGRE